MTEFNLPPLLQKSILHMGYEKPTQVQGQTIPCSLSGKDILVCAETGSGKTAAFGIPLVAQLLDKPQAQGLILTPTRELAQQVNEVVKLLCQFTDIKVACLVGGVDIRKQFRALSRKPSIIIGTPGRVTDHLMRKTLNLKNVRNLILDEGDRMLDMGFAPQLDKILKYLPTERQNSLFTATLSKRVKDLAERYLNSPKFFQVGQASRPVTAITQNVIQVRSPAKNDRLVDELNKRSGSVIIFAKTKRRTDSLALLLKDYGFPVAHIHGGRTQGQRNQALKRFREGGSRILCATDVAARGLDIPEVQVVINYDLPMQEEDYVHRIGRTARNGAKGEALSFVTPQDNGTWLRLVRKYKIQGADLVGVRAEDSDSSRGRKQKSAKGTKRSSSGAKQKFGSKSKSKSKSSSQGQGKKKKSSFSNTFKSKKKFKSKKQRSR